MGFEQPSGLWHHCQGSVGGVWGSTLYAHEPRSGVNTVADKMSKEQAMAAEDAVAAPALLSGGNPQIPKGDGDAPVQAFIAAMPGWKSDVGRRLDALIVRSVPEVRKAVRWNSPWWGVEGQGWFVSCHLFTRYIKVTFMKGIIYLCTTSYD